jgi:hypothetical protein
LYAIESTQLQNIDIIAMLLALPHHTIPRRNRIQLGLQQLLQIREHRQLFEAGQMVVADLLALCRELRDFLLALLDLRVEELLVAFHALNAFALAVQVLDLLVQTADFGLDYLAFEAAQLDFGVHAVHLVFQFVDSGLEVFHLVLDFGDGAVEGLFFGFVLAFGFFEDGLEVFLLFKFGCECTLLLFDLFQKLLNLFVDLLHGGIRQIRIRFDPSFRHPIGLLILLLLFLQQLLGPPEITQLPPNLLQLSLILGIPDLLLLYLINIPLQYNNTVPLTDSSPCPSP